MTTKEIAEACGVDERTVRRWIRGAGIKMPSLLDKLSDAEKTKMAAEYDLDETLAAIEKGMGKNAATLFRENAKNKAAPAEDRIARLESLVERLIIALIPAATSGKQLAIPAVPLATRDELRRIINSGAASAGGYREAWAALYQEIYYRLHRNVRECAKNRGMDTLDYIEEEGILPEAVAIAREIFR
jgi:hypothetical protein